MTRNNQKVVFAGGWRELIHAEEINSDIFSGGDFPPSVTWKPDGTKFILLFAANPDFLQEFTVPTPYDTTGAVAGATFVVDPPENNPRGMYWKLDGTRCYIVGTTFDKLFQLDLSTPWDVSTMSDPVISTFIVGINGAMQGMTFASHGKKCYITDSGDDIMEYELSTPFDLTTLNIIAIASIDLTIYGLDDPRDIVIHPDGTLLYVLSDAAKVVAVFFLSIAYDISSAQLLDVLDVSAQASAPQGLFIRQTDGKKLYLINGNDETLYTFDMSLATNKSLINNDGDEFVNENGEVLVYN